MTALNPKQQRFVVEYLIDLNATQAAIRAGYSPKTAKQQGARLLTNADIAAAVAKAAQARTVRVKYDADAVLQRLIEEAEADLADLFTDEGGLKPVKEWPPIWRRGLVASVKSYEERDEAGAVIGYNKEVRLSDRVKRLEMIGRHIAVGAFKEKVEHDVSDPLKKLYEEIAGRSIRPKEKTPADPVTPAPAVIRPRE